MKRTVFTVLALVATFIGVEASAYTWSAYDGGSAGSGNYRDAYSGNDSGTSNGHSYLSYGRTGNSGGYVGISTSGNSHSYVDAGNDVKVYVPLPVVHKPSGNYGRAINRKPRYRSAY